MSIFETLTQLRTQMRIDEIEYLLIPTGDYHLSEYVALHFRLRAHLSGFTGSAGTLVVGHNWAGLWTDSRYHLQAQAQLAGSSIVLYKAGNPGVPKILAALEQRLQPGETLAMDGRTISLDLCQSFQSMVKEKQAKLRIDWQCPHRIWPQRPPLPAAPVTLKTNTGREAADKLLHLRRHMAKRDAQGCLLTTLDDIAWLLNLRGNDIPNTPVFLSYLLLTNTKGTLFVNPAQISPEITTYLQTLSIEIAPYDAIDTACKNWNSGKILVTPGELNARLYTLLGESALDDTNTVAAAKAIKTPQEQENLRLCHQQDGCAMVGFLRWVKESVHNESITEVSAAAHLDALRHALPGNLGLSFPTISAYGEHGAIVHYEATAESDIPLAPTGFLLVDSGGQYENGTTDITRTIALGALTPEMRHHYTLVLQGMLALSSAVFPKGTTGATLDALARSPLWAEQLDYGHGTGHGIGYCLSVHEGPQSISHQRLASPAILPGMVTSDEPGLYIPGAYGIRLENAILCQEVGNSDFGDFLAFETLTLAPFDLDAVEVSMLTHVDRQRLNDYHKLVRDTLSPLLSDADAAWLRNATRPI